MKRNPQKMLNDINALLEQFNQETRIVEWGGSKIVLNTGTILYDSDRLNFIRRVTNKKTDLWVKNIDNLLSGNISDSAIRGMLSAIGGKVVWEKSKDNLKEKFKGRTPHNKGVTGKYKFGPRSEIVKELISKKNSGEGNGMYGSKMSDIDREFRSVLMKNKILLGEFTPHSNNKNTHWTAKFNNKKFRSSWEALYQFINPSAEYETLRIEYHLDNQTHIYIVDFIDHTNKIVVEVKPKELCIGDKFEAKISALSEWCEINEYTIIIVDKEWLQSQVVTIDYSLFDNETAKKIKSLYEANKKN